METLSGIKDVDIKIINQLNDHELGKVCQVNKYVNSLCKDETFWMNRTIDKFNLREKDSSYSWRDFYINLVMYKNTPGKGIMELSLEDGNFNDNKIWKNKYLIVYLEKLVSENTRKGFLSQIEYYLTEDRKYQGFNPYNESEIQEFIDARKYQIDAAIDSMYDAFYKEKELDYLDNTTVDWYREFLGDYIDWSEYFMS